MDNKAQKYIFLYLKTGGGHLAPARALVKYIQKNYPDKINTALVDGFEKTPKLIKYIIEDGYRNLQAAAKWYYELLYAINKVKLFGEVTASIISFFCRKYIEETILAEKPDKIIILHFFLIKPVYYVLKKHKLNTKIYTIVTDPFTAHPLWFHEKKQNYIIFSKRLENHILEKHDPQSINIFPFILDEKFSAQITSDKIELLKNDFKFPLNKKIILILGGGDGIPHGNKIINEVLNAQTGALVVIVCGRNKKLFKYATKIKTKTSYKDFIVFGFVDFIYELLNVSDIVVTKCGASTMMEILMIKKVPVVNDYIWEQEKGNIEFLIDNNFGIYEPVIKKLSPILQKLVNENQFYSFYNENIKKANIENGTGKVAEFLVAD